MSYYAPDPAALPTGIPFVRQLSERDLSLQIPVNYVNVPGISLTPACFAHRNYEDELATKCFSNLLAVGFDRFEIDVFWDATRHLWSLCPVQLGDLSGSNIGASISVSNALQDGPGHADLQSNELEARRPLVATESLTVPTSPSPSTRHTSKTSSITTTISPTTSTSNAPGATPSLGAGALVRVGPYSCTSTINLDLFAKVMSGHLGSTQINLNATLKYFLLNMHTAAPASDPTGSGQAPASNDLPRGNNALSAILSVSLSEYLYTPSNLFSERSDLNVSTSWFGNLQRFRPDPSYFSVYKDGDHYATDDGWPSESYIEMDLAKRLFVGYSRVDPQLSNYNFSADASMIFTTDYIQRTVPTTLNKAGQLQSGCFYRAGVYDLSSLNNSWADSAESVPLSGDVPPLGTILDRASNLPACGITPILNETLQNSTADQDFDPYKNYVQNTIWSWGPMQPQNASGHDQDGLSTLYRCAALNASSGYWQSENCAQSHHSACRLSGEIYEWQIGKYPTSYLKANLPCARGLEFTTPRTALENTYLVHAWRNAIADRDLDDVLLWVNFNDLDVASCWVIGQDSTCPYLRGQSHEREVVIPIVAAIVVFVLAVLTIFVKCAANRRQSKRRKRRRRGDDGFDYEGVPS